MSVYIYGLKDPQDGQIHYVGKAIKPNIRLLDHLRDKDSNEAKVAWIQGLRQTGCKPGMVILEEAEPDAWEAAERRWIKEGRKAGWPLTNILPGGICRRPGQAEPGWAELIARYLPAGERPIFASLSEAHQARVCQLTALWMMEYSALRIKQRGGDPRQEYDAHKQFWAGSRVARRLVDTLDNGTAKA